MPGLFLWCLLLPRLSEERNKLPNEEIQGQSDSGTLV